MNSLSSSSSESTLSTPLEFLSNSKPFKLSQQTAISTMLGKKYEKILFDSKLHEYLTKNLGDFAWAEKIWQGYKTILLPSLEDSQLKNLIEEWLQENCLNLGCSRLPLFQIMRNNLPSAIQIVWEKFVAEISCLEHIHDDKKARKQKIVIFSHTLGEKMVSDAILKHLMQRGLECFFIDVEENKEVDPCYIYSGISEHEMNLEVNYRQNNRELARRLWWCCEVIKEFIPDNTITDVIKRVKSLQPTLILSTRWDVPIEASIAPRLNIPMKIIHCDFGFSPLFKDNFRAASLIQFLIPSPDILHLPSNARPDEIRVLGYPLREGIEKVASSEALEAIKKQWNVSLNEDVVLIMTGSAGACRVKLLAIISFILSNEKKLPSIKFVIVCGNNSDLKNEVLSLLSNLPIGSPIKFEVFGWLNPYQISDWYNMANFYLGKLGGVTSAELIYIGLLALGFSEFLPEENNLNYLIKLGIAQKLDTEHLIDQIIHLLTLSKEKRSNNNNSNAIDWRKNLDFLITEENEN